MMFRLTVLFAALGLAACGGSIPTPAPSSERPMRIVSLDFCADNYVLKLADRDQILAVSPDAVRSFSYMSEAADGVPTVRSVAEDVLLLKPDLVVRSYGGGPNAAAFFERANIPVLQIGWAQSVHGTDVHSISSVIQGVADGLGQSPRGADLVNSFETRLSEIKAEASGKSTLYMTPSGVTTGGNSLIHEMMLAAGLTNFSEKVGWHSLPLERLAYERPDMVAAGYFESRTNHKHDWSAARHPIAQRELTDNQVVPLRGAWLACGGWFALEAIEAMAAGAQADG